MIGSNLTCGAVRAHKTLQRGGMMRTGRLLVLLGAIPVSGCINLTAPTEPIVIELNINITQEVIYRLAEDAGNTIDENADIF
jgi:YnbE-like lipoprotein